MIDKIKALFEKYKEIISYLFWGVMTTVVSWLTYSLFVKIIGIGDETVRVAVANVLSWICAVLFAFVTNKIWVFNSKKWNAGIVFPELIKFTVSRLATGVIEWVGVPLLVRIGLNQKIFGIDGIIAKILVSIVVIILNYVFSKLIVFRKNSRESREKDE